MEIANDSPYPVRLAGKLDRAADVPVEDLGRGLRLAPVERPDGSNLVVDLLPYGIAAIRIGARGEVPVDEFVSHRGGDDFDCATAAINELSAQLARLNHGLSASPSEPVNPGFEPNRLEKTTPKPGRKSSWRPRRTERGERTRLADGGPDGGRRDDRNRSRESHIPDWAA